MIVAIHQPNYLPYLGFFHKMSLADTFILYDTAQFSKNEFQNRNRIETPRGPLWLTVPVRRPGFRPMIEVEVDSTRPWSARHWQTIRVNYASSDHLERYAKELESLFDAPSGNLAALNETFIGFLVRAIGTSARIVRASELKIPEGLSASAKLAEMVRKVGGSVYLSGIDGPNYLELAPFEGLDVLVQTFRHPQYRQQWEGFLANLSALDAVLNIGPAVRELLSASGGSAPWP